MKKNIAPLLLVSFLQPATQVMAAAAPADWKTQFGQCLNTDGNYTRQVLNFTEVARLKYALQLQNIGSIAKADDNYANYINSILHLGKVTELLQQIRIAANKLKNNYFEEQFNDKRFQNFAGSQNFSILDIIVSDDFANPAINKDPRIIKILAGIKNQDPAYVEIGRLWSAIDQEITNNKETIRSSLSLLQRTSDFLNIEVSIVEPTLAQQLVDYSKFLQQGLKGQSVTVETLVTAIPYLKSTTPNNYSEIASEFVGRIVSRMLRSNDGSPVIEITAQQTQQFRKAKNPYYVQTVTSLVKNKKVAATAGVVDDAQLANYLNNTLKPQPFAFDQFLLKGYWQNQNRDLQKYGVADHNQVTYQQMAAIDGMARTLVGEAGLCQQFKAHQFEAISLVFAKRAQAIENYDTMNKMVMKSYQDPDLFQKQLDVLYSPNLNAEYSKYLVNNLRGRADYGRKDPKGMQLDPVAQALSAPRQFDTWQATRTEIVKLSSLMAKLPTNFPNIEFEIPTYKTAEEAAVYGTVLCPLGNPNSKDYNAYASSRQKLFNEALDIAYQVVLQRSKFLENYKFRTGTKSTTAVIDNIYFYTHGINLAFAQRALPTSIAKVDTKESLSIVIPNGVSKGACNKIMFFQPKTGNVYNLPR